MGREEQLTQAALLGLEGALRRLALMYPHMAAAGDWAAAQHQVLLTAAQAGGTPGLEHLPQRAPPVTVERQTERILVPLIKTI